VKEDPHGATVSGSQMAIGSAEITPFLNLPNDFVGKPSRMKTILVTGATRGIGRAVAHRFAADGFAVAVCSSTKSKVTQFESGFRKAFPRAPLIAERCDVSDKADVKRFVSIIKRKWSHLDVLVNNAGIFKSSGIINSTDKDFDVMVATNLASAYHVTRGLLGLLRKSSKGHVFNMCSTASRTAYPNGALYGITKFALYGFSKSLRVELMPDGISVTAVMPGAVWTDSWAGSNIPERRFMQPEEIAALMFDIYGMPKRAVVEEVLIRPIGGDV
jgi:NAD(P)-dependent dehydrogenase (short-subunit alcohol dehydrogenase family)